MSGLLSILAAADVAGRLPGEKVEDFIVRLARDRDAWKLLADSYATIRGDIASMCVDTEDVPPAPPTAREGRKK